MIELGINDTTYFVYERSGYYDVYGIWPTPILIPAVIVPGSIKELKATTNVFSPGQIIFREDAYDPVSRIRRGRFYRSNKDNVYFLQRWQITVHPAKPDGKTEEKNLYTFRDFPFKKEVADFLNDQPLIILGDQEAYTVWTIVSVEKTIKREELVTLRMRPTFGALPKIKEAKIPPDGRDKVLQKINMLAEDLHRAGPESVIDRAREAVTAILSSYLQDKRSAKGGDDLNALTNKLKELPEEDQKNVVHHAAHIIRLFHARGKTAEQERRNFRSITEEDAELAVQCVGTILCDLDWGEWV